MSTSNVPLVPQWNLTGGCVCTPDGGFLYVGARSINYIGKTEANDAAGAPLIKSFHTRQNIYSLAVDPVWPQQLDKGFASAAGGKRLFAIVAADSSIQIWDFDKECAISGHKVHLSIACVDGRGYSRRRAECLMSYMSNSSVLSISQQDLVVYCVASNSYWRRTSFLPTRCGQLTILRCSPQNEHIFAVGSSRGLVMVCDLQKMQVVFTLRGHDTAITSLSWNIMESVTVTDKSKEQQVVQDVEETTVAKAEKPELKKQKHSIDTDDIFDIYDYDYLDNEFGAPAAIDEKKSDCNETMELAQTDKVETEAVSTNFDFVEACMNLKQDIYALKNEPLIRTDNDDESQNTGVTLDDCKQVKTTALSSPSCSNESTEGSLELIDHSSSDDGVDVDGIEKPKQQILMYAEVHATQTQEANREKSGNEVIAYERHSETESKPQSSQPDAAQKCDDCTSECRDEDNLMDFSQQNVALLASASVDSKYWVWNAATGAACDNWIMRCVNGAANVHGKNTNIEIAWINTTKVVTSNKHGDLAIRKLKPQKHTTKNIFKFVDEKRNFSQRGVVAFDVGKHLNSHVMWSITNNRQVICEDLTTQEIIAKYCCASTNISAMCECPDDMNKIALGLSDRRVGILDLSKMSNNNVHIENFSHKIESAVLSIVWSPDSKKLAFGTSEGRIGIINVDNPKQQIIIFNPMGGKSVYSIDWKGNNIFAICYDNLGIYDASGKTKDAVVINNLGVLTAVSVRENFIFVGTKDGNVKIYTPLAAPAGAVGDKASSSFKWSQLTLVFEFKVSSRYIIAFAWSPVAADRCAIVCNENKIAVFEFDREAQKVVFKRNIRIKQPKAANSFVKWSNCDENLFVTSGMDGNVRVWDIGKENDEEKYVKHFHCPMMCALFLPTDENIIMCAGKSTSIEFVDMRVKCSSSNDPKRCNFPHSLDNVQWATKMLFGHENENAQKLSKTKLCKLRHLGGINQIETNLAEKTTAVAPAEQTTEDDAPAQEGEQIAEMLENLNLDTSQTPDSKNTGTKCYAGEHCIASYMRTPTTLLYLTTKELNKDALRLLRTLISNKNEVKSDNNILCFKLFGTKAEATKLLQFELDNHEHSATKGISQFFMPLVTLNLRDEIVKCIQNRTLTAWHLAMAPSVSYKFWHKCCTAYAEQLFEQGFAMQAASYVLAMHKHCEAIDMLMRRYYFKEALLVARIYLQPKDPRVDSIIDKWISHMDFTGNLAGAALLSTLYGQKNRAHEILSKQRNSTQEIDSILQLLATPASV